MNALELRRRTLGKGVYKKTVEGNPAIAQGSLARRYPGITMQGWTEQAQYEGSQLFDISKITPGDIGGSNITIDGEKIIVTNGPGSSGVYPKEPNSLLQYCPNIVAGKSYTLKFDTTGTNKNIYMQGYGAWGSGQTLNITEQILSSKIAFYASGPDTSATISNFMINEGSSALTYEPYTGGQPSPNPDYPQEITSAGKYDEGTGKYQYEVKLTGANLFNPDGERVSGLYMGTPLHNKSSVCMQLYEKDPDVDVTGCYIGLSKSGSGTEGGLNWALSNGNLNNSGLMVTASMDMYVTWFPTGETILQKIINRYDVMVNIGEQPLPYQPYKEQTVTLTSDRPLTKWDRLEKRNGQWGWVYKSAEKVLDGTEGYVTGGGNYISDFSSNCYTIISDMVRDGGDNAFMNRLSNIDYSWTLPDAIGFSKNLDQLHVRISNADLGTTGESSVSEVKAAMKTYMAQQYEEGNPFIFWYETAEETFVPLSESEQEQMNELYTFRPTTVLSNDCECEMSLTYKTKKSLEVAT